MIKKTYKELREELRENGLDSKYSEAGLNEIIDIERWNKKPIDFKYIEENYSEYDSMFEVLADMVNSDADNYEDGYEFFKDMRELQARVYCLKNGHIIISYVGCKN